MWTKEKSKEYLHQYYLDHKEHRKENDRLYRLKNLESIKAKSKAYYQANKEKIALRDKLYRLAHREEFLKKSAVARQGKREEAKKTSREWYAKNHEYALDRQRKYTAKHRELINAQRREYVKSHKEEIRDWHHSDKGHLCNRLSKQKRRGMKKTTSDNSITLKSWLTLVEHHEWKCAYCGSKQKLTIDHVVPLSKGGTHTLGNVLPACHSCNSSKQTKSLQDWLPTRNPVAQEVENHG